MGPEKIRAAASLVLERLGEKRVGFLWPAAPVFLERRSGFRWIHYCRRAFMPEGLAPEGQAVSPLEEGGKEAEGALLSEGRTLDMLAVPAGNAGVLCEVASGMTVSPESSLIEGALRASVPVLFDVSPFRAWLCSSSKRARACGRVLEPLAGRGMEFTGLPEFELTGPPEIPPSGETRSGPRAAAGTWFSWQEIAPLVRGSAVRLARGSRLTPEARDRLDRLNIRVEEVF